MVYTWIACVDTGYGVSCKQTVHSSRSGYSKHLGGERVSGKNWWLRFDQGFASGQRILQGQRAWRKPNILVRFCILICLGVSLSFGLILFCVFLKRQKGITEYYVVWYYEYDLCRSCTNILQTRSICFQVCPWILNGKQVLCGIRRVELRCCSVRTLHTQWQAL